MILASNKLFCQQKYYLKYYLVINNTFSIKLIVNIYGCSRLIDREESYETKSQNTRKGEILYG